MIWVNFQDLELGSVASVVLRPYRPAGIGVRDLIRVQLCRERAPVPNHITCETRVGTMRRGSCEEWTRSGVDLCSSVEDEFIDRQVVLAICESLIVGRTIDDVVAIDLLRSPILRIALDGEVER
jgi:hypothetical protein